MGEAMNEAVAERSMTASLPRVSVDYAAVRIFYGNVLHLHLDHSKLLSVQSWIITGKGFWIEYIMDGGSMQCEYDTREHWEHILSELSAKL